MPLEGWSWKFVETFIPFTSKIVCVLSLFMCFRRYGNLKFPYTYNDESESRPVYLSHCKYFDKIFTEIFLELSSTKYINVVQTAEFDWLSLQ